MRGSVRRARWGAGAAALMLAASARADWIQTIGIGERPALLGGAVTARGSDPAAWYYNPAGAGDLGGPLIAANARVLDSRALVFSDAGGEHRTDHTLGDSDVAVAPSVGAYLPIAALPGSERIPLADRVVFGLGFGAPFAITADWDDRGLPPLQQPQPVAVRARARSDGRPITGAVRIAASWAAGLSILGELLRAARGVPALDGATQDVAELGRTDAPSAGRRRRRPGCSRRRSRRPPRS